MRLNMNAITLKNQRGAVLAFSLVMLLLLTLVSISMIQQNKVQIGVATNAGQQVKAFATVETALRQAQAVLEPQRYVDKATHHCKSGATNSVHPAPHTSGTLTGLSAGITAKIKEAYCIYDYAGGVGTEEQCLYSSTGVRNTGPVGPIVNGVETAPTLNNIKACNKLNAAGNWSAGSPNANACQIEVYTLHVTLADATTGANRTVESKFEIDCSGDLNP
jgi:hypothetical protein